MDFPHERVDATPNILFMCSTLHCVHEYYSHHTININETWESKIQMMGLELGAPATPSLAQTLEHCQIHLPVYFPV